MKIDGISRQDILNEIKIEVHIIILIVQYFWESSIHSFLNKIYNLFYN